MALCAFFLHRLVNQLDGVAKIVAEQQTVIAVMRIEAKNSTDVLSKLDTLSLMLDRRISNLEKRNPN